LPVEVLDRAESVRLLRRRTGDSDTASADQLAEALGDLPLALEQAGAYCEAEQLPLAAYLERLRTDASDLFTEGQPVDYTHTVATTWTFGLEKAAKRSPHGPDLLRLLSFLGPDEIPWELLAPKLAERAGRPGVLGGLRMGELDRALGTLARYSLVKRTGAATTVHRLVQQVVRDGVDPEEQRAWTAAAVGLLLSAFPQNSHGHETWPVCQRLLPHALAAAQRVERLGGEPDAAALLLNYAALYLWTSAFKRASSASDSPCSRAKIGAPYPRSSRRVRRVPKWVSSRSCTTLSPALPPLALLTNTTPPPLSLSGGRNEIRVITA
jgi:hypothetical protein